MRKKSIKLAAGPCVTNVDEIGAFSQRGEKAAPVLAKQDESWCYDLSSIRLYRKFEGLTLNCVVTLFDNGTSTFSHVRRRAFPKLMNVEFCSVLICGGGYLDFVGPDGLLKVIKKVVPNGHWLPTVVGDATYTKALKRLRVLTNFAAHDSPISKKRALEAIGHERMSSSGAWLKMQNRFATICISL